MKPFYAQKLFDMGNGDTRSLEPLAALQKGLAMYRISPDTSTYFTIIYGVLVGVSSKVPILNVFSGIILQPPLSAGYIRAAQKLHRSEPARMDDFWSGFQNMKPLILWTLLVYGVLVGLLIPIMLVAGTGMFLTGSLIDGSVGIGALLMTLLGIAAVSLLAGPLLLYGFMLTLLADATPLEAFQGSIQIIKKYVVKLWVLLFLLFFINFIGALCLLIGLLVSIPVSFYAIYDAFVQVMGSEEQGDAVDTLLRHFNE